MLQPSPTLSTATWPIPGDAPDLQQIVWAQAQTVADQAALIDAYQQVLAGAQAVPPATGTGTAGTAPNDNVLTLTGVVGIVVAGAAVGGTGIAAGTVVVMQTGGTPGGNGTYQVSTTSTVSAAALTFTPGGGNPPWPAATDAGDLMLISQDQTGIIRMQTALLQQYQTLLNDSATPPPPTGP